MVSQDYLLALFLAVFLVLIFYSWYRERVYASSTSEHLSMTDPSIIGSSPPDPLPKAPQIVNDERSFYELTDGEKITYMIDTYFKGPYDPSTDSPDDNPDIAAQNQFINNLPTSSVAPPVTAVPPGVSPTCVDQFDGCAPWAANNECIINPEFMLYSCPQSCQACALTEQQKYTLVQIYNSRKPPHCAYRKGSYPDRLRFLNELEKVHNDPGIPI